MRAVAITVIAMGCSGGPSEPPAPEPRRIALAELSTTVPVEIRPNPELIPENGLEFTVRPRAVQSLTGPEFTVYQAIDGHAVEVLGSLERWTWNGDRTQATLRPQELTRGAPYLLVVDGLVGAGGQGIPRFARPFRVLPADVEPPSGRGVRVDGRPLAGTGDALVLTFPEAVRDDAVHKLAALDGGGAKAGSWMLNPEQTAATFTPAAPWGEGPVVVSVGAGIHDLGGNAMVHVPDGFLTPMVPIGEAP